MKEIKADFHSHTVFSDGNNSPEEMLARAAKEELSVFAITDHNTIEGIRNIDPERVLEQYNLHLIPGFELSLANGHYLILGMPLQSAEHIFEKYEIAPGTFAARLSEAKTKNVLRYFLDQGAAIIVAHPCIPTGIMSTSLKFLLELKDEKLIHGAESHNQQLANKTGPVYNFWHHQVKRLLEAEEIPTYKNSDAHVKKDISKRHNVFQNTDPSRIIDKIIDRSK